MVKPVKFCLYNTMTVMVEPEITVGCIRILSQVDKPGITMFNDIVDQFLHHPKDQQFLLHFKPCPVIMEANAGIEGTAAVYFLEKVTHGAFQSKVLEGRGHHAMADIPYQLNGIVDDL